MRVRITSLRAPWPDGAGVGSVIEIPGDVLPTVFAGKCEPAADTARATHVYAPPTRPQLASAPIEELLGVLEVPSVGVAALVARREELRARMLSIDISAAERRLDAAKAKREAAPFDVAPVAVYGRVPELDRQRVAHEVASEELKAAQGSLCQLRGELLAITGEIEYLTSMIDAEARVESSRAAAQGAEEHAASCHRLFAKAEADLQQIVERIKTEEIAYQAARDKAGTQLLDAIKAGNSDASIKAVTRDKVAVLEVARDVAEQEMQAARTAREQAEQRRRAAWQHVRLAEADVAESAFLQAEREYVEALYRVMFAKSVARHPFGAVDPRGEATERARHALERLGI
ncbi:MAG: hypothetical protein U1E60_31545 [Reyranellaceae bacterium]